MRWTERPSPSLAIKKVPSMIRNKPQSAKNKVVKPQEVKNVFNPKKLNKKKYDQTT
jgi:hypothetical protein